MKIIKLFLAWFCGFAAGVALNSYGVNEYISFSAAVLISFLVGIL